MTEDEAREKWCPFARVAVTEHSDMHASIASANRLPGTGGSAVDDPDLEWPSPRCIASDCMAWRKKLAVKWTDRNKGEPDPDPEIWGLINGDEGICEWRSYEPIQGYCGLAGQNIP